MAGRHGPHPITTTDELLELVIDELRGLRTDLAATSARPESSAPEPEESAGDGPVAVDIREPAKPVRRAPAKRAPSKES